MPDDFLKYEFFDHTADVMFVARGRTLADAFANAAYAMTDTITEHSLIRPVSSGRAAVEAEDEKALLYDFLEYFIILVDSEGFLLSKIDHIEIFQDYKSGTHKAIFEYSGDRDISSYEIKKAVKAVTYQQMNISHSDGICSVRVVLDI